MLSAVSTGSAPKALGPYSQAIRAGQFLFVSGQVPIDPATGELVPGSIGDQTRRVLQNIGEILKAAGGSFQQVVRTTVYLADLADFPAMNEAYATLLRYALPGTFHDPGRASPERRPHRNRRHRLPRLTSFNAETRRSRAHAELKERALRVLCVLGVLR